MSRSGNEDAIMNRSAVNHECKPVAAVAVAAAAPSQAETKPDVGTGKKRKFESHSSTQKSAMGVTGARIKHSHGGTPPSTAATKDDSSRLGPETTTTTSNAAAAATTSTGGADDAGVEIVRENSAWDALGERFETAASKGRFIDLTEEQQQKRLSPSKAAAEFSALQAPMDPSTMVQQEQPQASRSSSTTTTHTPDPPELERLWDMIRDAVGALKKARLGLSKAIEMKENNTGQLEASLRSINGRMSGIQRHVRRYTSTVLDSNVAVERIQEMNLLVSKANLLISQVNRHDDSYSEQQQGWGYHRYY